MALVAALLAGLAGPGTFVAVRAQSDDRTRVEAAARRATERMQALHKEADALAAQEGTLLAQLSELEAERQAKVSELQRVQAEVATTGRELADTNRHIAELERLTEQQRPTIEARLVQLYKLGRAGYLRLLLNVDDLRSLGRGYRMISALSLLDRQRVAEHLQTLASLRAARASLQERQQQSLALHAKARTARAEVERAVTAQTRLIQRIDERRDLNAQLAGELQQAQVKLQTALATAASGEAPASATVLPLRPFRGDLDWPANGPVATAFRGQPAATGEPALVRSGVEIAAAEGSPVRTVHEGLVAFADRFTGYGNLVIVDHGDQSFSLYGHLSTIAVRRGDQLGRRGVIGSVGRSPTGSPALYFEMRIDGQPVDPLQWLKDRTP